MRAAFIIVWIAFLVNVVSAAESITNLPPTKASEEFKQPNPASSGLLQVNLEQMVERADLIVTGQFPGFVNDKRSTVKIEVDEVLDGKLSKRDIIACFQATGLTVVVPDNSQWIFFFLKPFKIVGFADYRKVVGDNYDYNGIVRATPDTINTVRELVRKKSQKH